MKIIVCLDNRNGMLFNGRRQSRDREVCQKIADQTRGCRLWMNGYSSDLFRDISEEVLQDESFLDLANSEDYCFVENVDIVPYCHKISEIIVFRWNRSYPRDVVFPLQITGKWKLTNSVEFPGNSHDLITMEVYTL